MQGSKYVHSRFDHLYDWLMMHISDKIVVSSNDFKIEQRYLDWTIYTNIFVCLRLWNNFLLTKVLLVRRLKAMIVMMG